MNRRSVNHRKDEQGASLILVIAFMVIVGAISAAVISTAASGVQERVALDQARDRQYAADAAVETTIAAARGLGGTCPTPQPSTPFTLNHVHIHVDCQGSPAVIVGPDGIPKLQKNLSFVACIATGPGYGTPCAAAANIISAQVNFQGTAPAVTTYVQAWTVNR